MTRLTKLIAPALATVIALAATMPAQARDSGPGFHRNPAASRNLHDYRPIAVPARHSGRFGFRAEINDLQRDIERAAARRMISWREAAGLRSDAYRLERIYRSYSRGGLSRWERASLDRKVTKLRRALRIDMHDRDRRRG